MVSTLVVERLDVNLQLPSYSNSGDSGMDLHTRLYADHYELDTLTVDPHEMVTVGTGIRAQIPEGYEIQIRPRSGLTREGLVAQFGTVDSGYRGEWLVNVLNTTEDPITIRYGDRIAQAVLAPVTRANIVEGVVSVDTERGQSGFGSTGR